MPGRTLFPNLSEFVTFAAAPLALTSFVRNQCSATSAFTLLTVLYYTILYYTILYYTILYYTILCYTMLYYTILYYTILYYTILYYTILYYTILDFTILDYTIRVCYRPLLCCGVRGNVWATSLLTGTSGRGQAAANAWPSRCFVYSGAKTRGGRKRTCEVTGRRRVCLQSSRVA